MLKVPTRKEIGALLKVIRKINGLTQIQMAKILHVSQASISKFEDGILEMSASEMIRLCEELKVPYEAFVKGYLDNKINADFMPRKDVSNFTVRREYLPNCIYNVRAIRPFLQYMESTLGTEKSHKTIKEKMHVDPHYLMMMDSQVNGKFLHDLAELVPFKNKNFLTYLREDFCTDTFHGDCHTLYTKSTSSFDAIRKYLKRSSLYETEFEREIELDKDDRMVVTYQKKNESALDHIVPGYHGIFLENFVGYSMNKDEKLEVKTLLKTDSKIQFELTAC